MFKGVSRAEIKSVAVTTFTKASEIHTLLPSTFLGTCIVLPIRGIIQSANRLAAVQCKKNSSRLSSRAVVNVHVKHQNWNKMRSLWPWHGGAVEHPLSRSSVGVNNLWMRDVIGQWRNQTSWQEGRNKSIKMIGLLSYRGAYIYFASVVWLHLSP